MCAAPVSLQLRLFGGDEPPGIHPLVQFDVQLAADQVKIPLAGVYGSQQVKQALISLKGHAASGEIQHSLSVFRSAAGGIRSVQCQHHRVEKLNLPLLCFVPEADSLTLALRKLKAHGPVCRCQTCLVIEENVARSDTHKPRATYLPVLLRLGPSWSEARSSSICTSPAQLMLSEAVK